jgi:hypothetical protein
LLVIRWSGPSVFASVGFQLKDSPVFGSVTFLAVTNCGVFQKLMLVERWNWATYSPKINGSGSSSRRQLLEQLFGNNLTPSLADPAVQARFPVRNKRNPPSVPSIEALPGFFADRSRRVPPQYSVLP